MEKLKAGDQFPKFEIDTVAHGHIGVPDDLKGRYAVLLFYRGWW